MRIFGSLIKSLPLVLATQFSAASSNAQVLRTVETDALHAPALTNTNAPSIYIVTERMSQFIKSYISKLESIPYANTNEQVDMKVKVDWLKLAIPEANKTFAEVKKHFSSHQERDKAYSSILSVIARRIGYLSGSEEFALALFQAGWSISPDYSFSQIAGNFSKRLSESKTGMTDTLFFPVEKPAFKSVNINNYPALTNLFSPFIADKSHTLTKVDIYRLSPTVTNKIALDNAGITVPLPNDSLIILNPRYANADPSHSSLIYRTEINELAHLFLGKYAPNFCRAGAKVFALNIDGVLAKASGDDVIEFISDAVNIHAGDNADVARLLYIASNRKTTYGALSSLVAEIVLSDLAAKYGFNQGFPVVNSEKGTLEALNFMLKQQNPTKNPNDFYDEFRVKFTSIARKVIEFIKGYEVKEATVLPSSK